MTTLTAGSTANFSLSGRQVLTLTADNNTTGTIKRTQYVESSSSKTDTLGPPATNRTYGPFGHETDIELTCTYGSFEYDVTGTSLVTAETDPVTGKIEKLLANGSDVYRDLTMLPYPAFHASRPMQSIIIPFGTVTVDEISVAGATINREIDTTSTFNGRATSKYTCTVGGSTANFEVGVSTASLTLDSNGQSVLTRQPFCAVKCGPGNAVLNGKLFIGDSTYTNYYTFDMIVVGRVGDWVLLGKRAVGYSGVSGTPNLAAAVRSKMRVTMTANVAPGEVWVSPLYAVSAPKPSVVFSVDDGIDEWPWLAAEAYKRGVPLSMGIACDLVGTAGYMSWGQVQALQNDYGGFHAITNHARVNSGFTDIGLAAYVSDVDLCRDMLVSHGVPYKTASMHQYVKGQYDSTLIAELKVRGYLSCRAVGTSGAGAANLGIAATGSTADHLFSIPATCDLGNNQNLTTVKAHITNAAQVGSAFIMGHGFEAAAAPYTYVAGYDSSYGVLDLLDWLAEQRDLNGWQLLNWADWYDNMFMPKLPAVL